MIFNFKIFLNEKYINIFDTDTMLKYSDIVYNMIKKAYEPIGGLKGNGFLNPIDMVNSMKLIKIYKNNNQILCCVCYKDKNGRKMVALGTDGTQKAKEELKKILKMEFDRSYMEVSGTLLNFIKKTYPILFDKYKIKNNTNLIIFKDIIAIDEYYYIRNINNENVTKIALGTPNKKFI